MLNDFMSNGLRVRIFHNRRELGTCAGHEIALKIRELLGYKNSINIMFASGQSQIETLETLCGEKGIDWGRVNAFMTTEFLGLKEGHAAKCSTFLKNAIFDRKNFRSVNIIDGNAENAQMEAERYETLLQHNRMDICVLGIGENGHLAFNEPDPENSANFTDENLVKIVALEDTSRLQQVHDTLFNYVNEVPTHAITVTLPVILSAAWIFCPVSGSAKAVAVNRMLNEDISASCPASSLRQHPHANLYSDRFAAGVILYGF